MSENYYIEHIFLIDYHIQLLSTYKKKSSNFDICFIFLVNYIKLESTA